MSVPQALSLSVTTSGRRPKKQVSTVCTNCSVGCQMVAEVNRFDKVIRFRGDLWLARPTGARLASRASSHMTTRTTSDRLKSPYMYGQDGMLKKVDTPDSSQRQIAEALKKYSPSEVAVIASPRGSNEDNYVAAKFARDGLKHEQRGLWPEHGAGSLLETMQRATRAQPARRTRSGTLSPRSASSSSAATRPRSRTCWQFRRRRQPGLAQRSL